VCAITRTFDENTEYTLTAAEVKKQEMARVQKIEALRVTKDTGPDEDMGLRDFIVYVAKWAWNLVRRKHD